MRPGRNHFKQFYSNIWMVKMMIKKFLYCKVDGEYRVYCNICDKLCIERFLKKHLDSQTHATNIRKREQLNI